MPIDLGKYHADPLLLTFLFQEHLNFYGRDDKHGPIIMSIKVENGQYRVIIRCLDGNFERYFNVNDAGLILIKKIKIILIK